PVAGVPGPRGVAGDADRACGSGVGATAPRGLGRIPDAITGLHAEIGRRIGERAGQRGRARPGRSTRRGRPRFCPPTSRYALTLPAEALEWDIEAVSRRELPAGSVSPTHSPVRARSCA